MIVMLMGALTSALVYTHHTIYTAGFDDGTMAGKLLVVNAKNEGLQDYVRLQKTLTAAEATTKLIEAKLDRELNKVAATGQVQVVTVEKIINANPDFASITRPAALDELRQQSFREIAAAADRGQSAAAKLSGRGVQAVRRSGIDFGQYAGRDREGGRDQPYTLASLHSETHSVAGMRF